MEQVDAPAVLVALLLNRAAGLVEQGYAGPAAIDRAMTLGCGLPAGPFGQLAAIGPGAVAGVLESAGITPSPLLLFSPPAPSPQPPATAAEPPHTARPVDRIGVVGSGVMARGIAQVTAVHGYPTVLAARTAGRAGEALAGVSAALGKAVARGKLPAAAAADAAGRLSADGDLTALHDCDVVIEAVAEDPDVKHAVFARLDEVCPPHAILATSTSSLDVAGCADATLRPRSVIGMHFFNPAPAMRLVEVAHTDRSGPDVVATVHALVHALGKTPVGCPDRTGFIVNYLLLPYLNDAVGMLEQGLCEAAAMDQAVRDRFGYPMGPFTLLDSIGLDVSLAIQRRLHDRFGETVAAAPAKTLSDLVQDGHLGRKSGRGFLTWS